VEAACTSLTLKIAKFCSQTGTQKNMILLNNSDDELGFNVTVWWNDDIMSGQPPPIILAKISDVGNTVLINHLHKESDQQPSLIKTHKNLIKLRHQWTYLLNAGNLNR